MSNLSNATWGDCHWAGIGASFQCLNFSAPLDYQNLSLGTIQLAAIKLPAFQSPKIGTMFLNIGGPGESIFNDWSSYPEDARSLQNQIGQDWDLVSWDPRAVNYSEPFLRFFDTVAEEDAFWAASSAPGGFYSHPPLWSDSDIQTFMGFVTEKDALMTQLNDLAVTRNGDKLKYIGTVANARDMATLSNLIDGPNSTVNYYGYSYGTLLGAFFTQLYPERTGRIILDGVMDPFAMTQTQAYLGVSSEMPDTEAVWKGFITACAHAGPSNCSFASLGDDPAAITTKFEGLVQRINNGFNGTYASSDTVLSNVFSSLYWPDGWWYLADYLDCLQGIFPAPGSPSKRSLTQRDSSSSNEHRKGGNARFNPPFHSTSTSHRKRSYPGEFDAYCSLPSGPAVFYVLLAVFCSDTPDSTGQTTQDVFNEVVQVTKSITRTFGFLDDQRYWCHRWSTRAAERYTGTWNHTLANPALIIGNEADPVTPYRNAKLLASSDYLGSSARLVQRWDFGHTSSSETSACINQLLWNYTHGILPADKGNDNADLICNTTDSILGLPITTHFDPATTGDDSTTSNSTNSGARSSKSLFITDSSGIGLLTCSVLVISGVWLSIFA